MGGGAATPFSFESRLITSVWIQLYTCEVCVRGVPGMCQGCIRVSEGVSGVYQERITGVPGVSGVYPGCGTA